jgi:hypothetical protein
MLPWLVVANYGDVEGNERVTAAEEAAPSF